MSNPTVSVARSVSERASDLVAFEATETIQAGPIETTARIRFRKPDHVVVEYSAYKNPIAEADELLGGDIEFASDDLLAMTLTYDGAHTWHSSARSGFPLKRIGRTLYEPLPGYDALAELGFLADLTHDFLIRDEGSTNELGRPALALGLKPKRARESLLLKSVSYPFERAILDVDAESLFPVRIRFRPPARSTLASILEPGAWVTIRYTNPRLGEPGADAFALATPGDARLLEEAFVRTADLPNLLPIPLRLDALTAAGFEILEPCSAAVDRSHERGYAAVGLGRRSTEEAPDGAFLTLRVGNYLSRHMARRRALISERGEELSLGERNARFLDRRVLFEKDGAPPSSLAFLLEVSWEQDGVFAILTGDGLSGPELIELASRLAAPR
ncbi:MAG: hypothetical protein NTY63_05840 [Candidatus Bipolaricaulota bacterium]|nr:hypothetical protein [Candidatus Bipolaricaulota bacterium]